MSDLVERQLRVSAAVAEISRFREEVLQVAWHLTHPEKRHLLIQVERRGLDLMQDWSVACLVAQNPREGV